MTKKKLAVKKYNRRAFLNKIGHHTVALIYAHVTASERGVGGYITINDCSDSISLELASWNQRDYTNTLYKIDKLIEVLQGVRTFVLDNPPTFKKSDEDGDEYF